MVIERDGSIDAAGRACTQRNACALRRQKPGGCLAQATARSRDDDDFSFDVIAHRKLL
jgi:hypothetical protein